MSNAADRIYDMDMRKLGLLSLPTWLRRPLVSALLLAGMSPLSRLLQELRHTRADTLYRLTHNGQVCRLRGALNDAFDPRQRRIRVEEGAEAKSLMARRRGDGGWLMVPERPGALGVSRRGFGPAGGSDFIVAAPGELRGSEGRVRGLVNAYRLASKRFTIIFE